jgi:hypothetical protein
MTQTQVSNDPMAKVWGIVPRYMRERQAAEAAAEALALELEAAAPKPAPVVVEEEVGGTVDAVTADLRRRLATQAPRRPGLGMAVPALAGLSIVFGALISH